MQAHSPTLPTVEDFRDASSVQVNNIMIDVAHAAAGYLNTFFRTQGMPAPYLEEQEIFNRLLILEGVEPQEVEILE